MRESLDWDNEVHFLGDGGRPVHGLEFRKRREVQTLSDLLPQGLPDTDGSWPVNQHNPFIPYIVFVKCFAMAMWKITVQSFKRQLCMLVVYCLKTFLRKSGSEKQARHRRVLHSAPFKKSGGDEQHHLCLHVE